MPAFPHRCLTVAPGRSVAVLLLLAGLFAPAMASAEPANAENGAGSAIDPARETEAQRYIVSVERIWNRAGHSAFTDLVEFRGALYCTFREGTGHIPGQNGLVRVITSSDGMNWQSVALLDEQHVDLRDPKLSVTPDGRLMVNTGASYYHGTARQRIESRVSFSDKEGRNFSRPQRIIFPPTVLSGFDWLWRVTWVDDWAYAAVQQVPNQGDRGLHLVRSRDGVTYEHVAPLPVEGPSETTLRLLPDKTMIAMSRRSPGPNKGSIGVAKPPYKKWTYRESNKRFGGPNLMQLPNGSWIAGSRDYPATGAVTRLWRLHPDTATFTDLVTLPSGGDTSYPGFVIDEKRGELLVSYYSSHEGKGSIYLARLRLDALSQPKEK